MSAHDDWLDAPKHRADARALRLTCPECGEQMEEDTHERSVDCPACDYSDGVDWDSVRDERMER